MRRQSTERDVHVHLGSHGEAVLQEEVLQEVKLRPPGEVSWCDTSYPLGTPSSNSCIKGGKVTRQEDCRHAANVLNLTTGDSFVINDDWVNPDVFSKDCFVFNKTVFFNPTESVRTAGWQGTPICHYQIYKSGNISIDSHEGCNGDYEPITTYRECMWAHDCEWGGMFCQETTFGDDTFKTDKAPRGCYRSAIGCYGFNANTTAPDGNITGKSGVCRLKSYTFDVAKMQRTRAAR